MGQFEDATSLRELHKAIRQCKRGVSHKEGPVDWYTHGLCKARALQDQLRGGRYKLRPGVPVEIYRPKRRTAIAPWFKDRVWQRSMCNNGVYDDLTRSLVYDNVACQTGKGTDLAIRRTVAALQHMYRVAGSNDGWGVHLDGKKYFPMTPQSHVREQDHRLVREQRYHQYLDEIVASIKDPRDPSVIAADPFGPRGTGLGSQINQLNQVALMSEVDHELRCFCRFAERYMDDYLVLDNDRSVCERAGRVVREGYARHGLDCKDLGGVFRVKDGFYFLRHYFVLTDTGKVIIRLHPETMRRERAALLALKADVDAGRRTMEDVQRHYQCFIASAEYSSGDGCIRDMDAFYTKVFRARPVYKRSRRYLYGKRC